MILVTGPTGSGKTVSLYTCLNLLNTPGVNISTAEDPSEINLPGVNQVNVNDKAGLTFAAALRSFLRQDPDILMVGEIRDLETADIAIKAAQTGHLVLSTLHTNDAPTTLTRLRNMGIAPFNIASSVIEQRRAEGLGQCVGQVGRRDRPRARQLGDEGGACGLRPSAQIQCGRLPELPGLDEGLGQPGQGVEVRGRNRCGHRSRAGTRRAWAHRRLSWERPPIISEAGKSVNLVITRMTLAGARSAAAFGHDHDVVGRRTGFDLHPQALEEHLEVVPLGAANGEGGYTRHVDRFADLEHQRAHLVLAVQNAHARRLHGFHMHIGRRLVGHRRVVLRRLAGTGGLAAGGQGGLVRARDDDRRSGGG
jgi:hypothetical protein